MLYNLGILWIFIQNTRPYAVLTESDDGLNLTISGDGSINSSAVHSLSYDKLKYIHINDGITRIEESAFSDCSSLIAIQLPRRLEYLGTKSFDGCINIVSISLPEGLINIPPHVFINCNNLRNISISSTTENIDPQFMHTCPKMNKFIVDVYNKFYSTVQNGEILTSYNKTIAIYCKGSGILTIPNEIEVFGENFCYHKDVTLIKFASGSNLKALRLRFLYDAKFVTSFEAPSSLQQVGDFSFFGSYVINISFPSTLSYMSPSAFSGNNNLQNVFISDDCPAIKKVGGIIYSPDGKHIVFIPLSVTNLSISENLESFEHALIRSTKSLEAVNVHPDNNVYSHYDDALYTKYKDTIKASPYRKRVIHVHKNCTTIEDCTFMNTLVTEVYFEGNIRVIGTEGFSMCKNLEKLDFQSSIERIGSWVFTSCSLWKSSITFGSNFESSKECSFYSSGIISADLSHTKMTSIPAEMFYYCSSLQEVKLPPLCTNINSNSFIGCNIASITINNIVKSISNSAFANCYNLTDVIFEDESDLETIGSSSFAFTNISKIILSSSLRTISSKSFQGCSLLENLIFSDKSQLNSIEADAFDGCNLLKEVILPSSISMINPTAFSICLSLLNIIIGDGVTEGSVYCSIDGAVFSKDKLTLVICPSGRDMFEVETFVKWIGQKAFMNCKKLTNLVFGRGSQIESLNTSTFEGCSALTKVVFLDNEESDNYKRMSGSQRKKGRSGSRLVEIGSRVFCGCSSLEIFKFPPSVRRIKASAFENCSQLMTILPAGLERIEMSGFRNCKSLRRVDFGAKVLYIGADCFSGCSELSIVTYCGTTALLEKAFGDPSASISCFVLPEYPSHFLCNLPVLKALDIECISKFNSFIIERKFLFNPKLHDS